MKALPTDCDNQIQLLQSQLTQSPHNAALYFQLGLLYLNEKAYPQALLALEQAITYAPKQAQYYNVKGVCHILLEQPALAKTDFLKSYALNPLQAEVCINLGTHALKEQAFSQAIDYFEQALSLQPDNANANNNLATAYMALNLQQKAYETIKKALTLNPNHSLAQFNLAKLEKHFGHIHQSQRLLESILQQTPHHINAKAELADVLRIQNQDKEAIALLHEVLDCEQTHPNANHYAGLLAYNQGHWKEALAYFERAFAHASHSLFILGMIGHCQLATGDWQGWHQTQQQARTLLHQGQPFEPINPFIGQCLFPDLADYKAICEQWGQFFISKTLAPPYARKSYGHKKLRIGYISPNFTVHPVGLQINQLFKYHDREHFEIYAFPTKVHNTPLYYEICGHCDHVVELDNQNFDDTAALIRKHEIDILVDLAGPTDNHCYDVLARHPAPVQCHMLGATGTLGTSFIDYIITTQTIVKDEFIPQYTEVPVRLPETEIARCGFDVPNTTIYRKDWGLPEDKIVILAYHNFYRIDEATWMTWLEILAKTDNTVLWVKVPNASFLSTLLAKTKLAGIDVDRIIPCYEKSLTTHWQHQLADFFVDSLSFTSGTCIFLSQWIGLPVLTYQGQTPQARVGASFCRASSILEQVAKDRSDYIAKAIDWASHPDKLKAIKQQLLVQREHSPLFNPQRYMHHLEAAYMAMWNDFTQRSNKAVIDIEPINSPN